MWVWLGTFCAGGIVVASVRADDDTFNCEDSCVYANDGQCDEDQVHDDSGRALRATRLFMAPECAGSMSCLM